MQKYPVMKSVLLTFFSLILFISSWAQTNQNPNQSFAKIISGKISDTLTGQSLEFVSIRAFSYTDSIVIGGALTDSNGTFRITDIRDKHIFLKISFVGYETKILKSIKLDGNIPELNLGKISLRSSFQNLTEVKIIGQADIYKTGIDKKIYNVGEDLNTQGSSASEVLTNIPSVDVDQEGKISLRGDGNVIVLIDGRPSTLTLNGGLEGLPANSIERIEVVTNPSAKYDPDGTSGIINIVLKKAKLRGINGTISGTYGTGNSYNGATSINIRTNKINVFANYAYKYVDGYRDFTSQLSKTTALGTTLFQQTRPGTHLRINQNLRVGADFYLTTKQTLGFSMNGALGDEDRAGILNNTLLDEQNILKTNWLRNSSDISGDKNFDINVNYKNELKEKKGELSADFTTSFGNETKKGKYSNEYLTNLYLVSNQNKLVQQLENDQNNKVSTCQIDYTKNVEGQKARIEIGTKGIFRKEKLTTKSQTFSDSTNQFAEDTLANFRYHYDERIYAIYAIWGQEVGKLKYQLGVRGEYAEQNPNLIDDSIYINNNYFTLFPSAHIRYNLLNKKEISLSYSRRIERASSEQLNPFSDYSDPLNLRLGNPYLTPQFVNSFDLGFSLEKEKLVFTSSIFYRHSSDVIQRVKVFYQDNVTATTYGNIDQSNSYGFEMGFNYKPIKRWRNSLSLNADRIEYFNSLGETSFTNSGYNLGFKVNSTFDFWKNTSSIQVNFRYNTPRITAQGKVQPRQAFDISGEKKLNNHWSFGFRISDLFNTQGFRYDFEQENIRQIGEFKWLTRRLYFTLSYKFGKLEVGKKEGRNPESGGGGFDF